MSEFLDRLDEIIGTASEDSDIRASIVPCFEYDFDSAPLRLARCQGVIISEDGREWIGTVDGSGGDRHQTPPLRDGRDGTSARLEFGLNFLDKATFDAIKAEHEPVAGRTITAYLAIVEQGEGARPATPLEFLGRFVMQSPTFADGFGGAGGTYRRNYRITVVAKDGNAGRSRAQRGTYSDTSQQERAAALGVAVDYGCGFVAALSNTTLQFP